MEENNTKLTEIIEDKVNESLKEFQYKLIKTLESMINTQMIIINDNIINIHPSTPRNDNLPVNQTQNILNVSQTPTISKKTTYLQNNSSTQAYTHADPNTQEPTNIITEN